MSSSLPHFLLTLLGVGCSTGGAAMLNNYLERDPDAKMARTRGRALPAGLVRPQNALTVGVSLVMSGVLLLASGRESLNRVSCAAGGVSLCARLHTA